MEFAGGAQSNWNASEGEPGHVLNRTHWVESGITLLAEIKKRSYSDDLPYAPVLGEEYIVTFGATTYNCVAKTTKDSNLTMIYIGNASLKNESLENTGEPWIYFYYELNGMTAGGALWTDESATDDTIFVYQEAETIHKLDPKFLPDGVPYMSESEEIPLSYEKPTGMDDTGWQITSPVTLEIGETYKVVWGGVEYNCIAQDAGATLGITAAILGNLPALNGTGDSGEPFVGLFADYEVGNGAYGTVIPVNGGRKEFSIYGSGLHKLDPRLVPDGTPSIFEQEKLLRKGTWQVMPQGQLTGKGESIITFTEPLVVGQTYKVRWDLDYYECVARVLAGEYNGMDMEAIVIGNAALFGYPDTGEPFLAGDIYSPQETSLVISVNDVGGEHFFEVHKVARDIKKLDNRCLDLEWLPVINKAYLIPEQTVSAVDTAPDGSYMAIVKTNPEWDGGFSVNEKTPLTISFQGIDFPAFGGGTMDGDFIAPEAGDFYFAGFNDSWVIIVPSPGTYTISVSDPALSAYNKMPEEFLPDSTATKEYVDEAINKIEYPTPPVTSVNGKTGEVNLTATDVGALPSDTVIPSIEGLATESYVDTKVSSLVDTAPETLNTLNELAAALGDDPNFATTIATQIGEKASSADLTAHISNTSNPHGVTAEQIGAATTSYVDTAVGAVPKVVVDSALSDTSTNPVQNKVIKTALDKKPGEVVTGKNHVIDGNTVTAGTGAEVFNNLTYNKAIGNYSHAEGRFTTASGSEAHAEGKNNVASGDSSHAEGDGTTASGRCAHAEGAGTTASSHSCHAEGWSTTASGYYCHAEGKVTIAKSYCAHAEGEGTIACANQHVQGKYNIEDTSDKYAHIVGNGTSDTERSNAHTLDWNGNAWFAGDVYVGSTSGTNKDEGSVKLATEEFVKQYVEQYIKNYLDTIIAEGGSW